MFILLTVLHVVFCIFLILVILLQTGKGGGMGAAFGGGGSSTVFGPRGAGSFIGKATGTVAAAFMLTSLSLAYLSSSSSTGLSEKAALIEGETQSKEVDLGPAQDNTPAEAPIMPAAEPDKAADAGFADSGSEEAAATAQPAQAPDAPVASPGAP